MPLPCWGDTADDLTVWRRRTSAPPHGAPAHSRPTPCTNPSTTPDPNPKRTAEVHPAQASAAREEEAALRRQLRMELRQTCMKLGSDRRFRSGPTLQAYAEA